MRTTCLTLVLLLAAASTLSSAKPLQKLLEEARKSHSKHRFNDKESNALKWEAYESCKLDIAFVVDASTSINGKGLKKSKAAIVDILNDVVPSDGPGEKPHVALVTYNRSPRLEWNLDAPNDLNSLQSRVEALQYEATRGTATGDGLNVVSEQVNSNEANKYVILFTDGYENTGAKHDVDVAKTLKEDGKWTILVVAMGWKPNEDNLQQVASDKDSVYALNTLNDLKARLKSKSCIVVTPPPPTTTPAPLPTKPECTDKSRGDVVFVLDASTSIGKRNFPYLIQTVEGVVPLLMLGPGDQPSDVQIAAVLFSRRPEILWQWDPQNTRNQIQEKVKNQVVYNDKVWGTCTGDALYQVRTEVKHAPGEEREADVPKIIILITDGMQDLGKHQDVEEAQKLKDEGWLIFVISVGWNVKQDVLDQMSSGEQFRAHAKNYQDLKKNLEKIAILACHTF